MVPDSATVTPLSDDGRFSERVNRLQAVWRKVRRVALIAFDFVVPPELFKQPEMRCDRVLRWWTVIIDDLSLLGCRR